MEPKNYGSIILGAAVIGLVFLNIKFNKRTELLRDAVVRTGEIIDTQFQAAIDEKFAEIVENYEE